MVIQVHEAHEIEWEDCFNSLKTCAGIAIDIVTAIFPHPYLNVVKLQLRCIYYFICASFGESNKSQPLLKFWVPCTWILTIIQKSTELSSPSFSWPTPSPRNDDRLVNHLHCIPSIHSLSAVTAHSGIKSVSLHSGVTHHEHHRHSFPPPC